MANDTGIDYRIINEMLAFMVDLKLFECVNQTIKCLKMSTRTDEYTQKLIRSMPTVPTISGQCPDNIPPNRIEEKRREENNNSANFEIFWKNNPKKSDKKKAQLAFNRLSPAKQELAINDIKTRYSETEKKYIPLPTTYLNGERWEDDKPKGEFDDMYYPGCE